MNHLKKKNGNNHSQQKRRLFTNLPFLIAVLLIVANSSFSYSNNKSQEELTNKFIVPTGLSYTNWLKKYIPAEYQGVKIIDNKDWYQAIIPELELTISWAFLPQEKLALKDVHGHYEGKSMFISEPAKENWTNISNLEYTKGAGYYLPSYSSSSMGNLEVAKLSVLQFRGGNTRKFVDKMIKEWQLASLTAKNKNYKPRVINTTDLGADPDDKQSMVRQLVSANEFDIEGLIVATGCWRKTQSNTTMLDKLVNAYEESYPNLSVHANGFPTPEYLKSISVMGQTGYGMSDVGTGKDSAGSELIIASVDKDDPRPVWVMGWGGMNNAAQAIWKVRETRSPEELKEFLSKLRLFDILGQDDAGAWIAKTFPDVFYIRATGVYGWAPPKNGTYQRDDIQSHGPLGAVYPDTKWATEGDTPAFMHVYPNGLNDPEQIDQGGWGGRFSFEKQAGIRSMSGVKKIEEKGESKYDPYYMYGNTPEKSKAIKKWNKGYNNDFAARMDWSITSNYEEANHHPIAILNGDKTRNVLTINATAGSNIELNANGSSDPDGNNLSYAWSFYNEPSSYNGDITIPNNTSYSTKLKIPEDAANKNIHIILEVYDDGSPNLYAYRRLIVNVQPSKKTSLNNEEPLSGMPYVTFQNKVVVTKVRHFDNICWKIAAAGGTWYFENGETDGKSGFSSAFDKAGNDWIGNDADRGYNKSPNKGGRHEYRGWPNFGEGNFNHPQRKSNSTSRWIDENGNNIEFKDKLEGDHLIMIASNATYELEYHFFTTHAAIKIIRADDKYAFLFEGPIGGEQESQIDKDYYVLKDGVHREVKSGGLGYLEPEFGNKFPSSFFYLVDSDPKDAQVFYAAVKNVGPDSAGDEGWRQGDNMVIFSFGRDEDKRAYTGTDAVCVFGFYDKTSHKKISRFIKSTLKNQFE
ncbi:nucleoside hydrolase-like domain-containing protein [Thalassobellus sediminis]|uniref:nucleoside hydrolase-like domain-containing protein n=1 Tax=Thalassobellus sediminis TaxID=3367753 RepID=UPI0037A29C51